MADSLSTFPSVAEFYRGRNIFLTGGTGFIGKVFIEKILRCCPDIGDIYMLVRPRRSQSVHERLKKMFKEKVSCAIHISGFWELVVIWIFCEFPALWQFMIDIHVDSIDSYD